MQEIILMQGDSSYLLYRDEQGKLLCAHSSNGAIIKTSVLTELEAEHFCADIDAQGTIHIVFFARKMLTYLLWKDNKATIYHLTRLVTQTHNLTSLKISAGAEICLYYTLSHGEGTSIILYRRKNDIWSGNRIYHSIEPTTLLLADKQKNRVFYQKQMQDKYMLVCYDNTNSTIFESEEPFSQVQAINDHIIFCSGKRIYDNSLLVAVGSQPCLYNNEIQPMLVYKNDGQFYKMQYAGDSWQKQSIYPVGNSYRLYALAMPTFSQSYIFSPTFPEVRMPAQTSITTAAPRENLQIKELEDEVYLHKRTIFNLQAEMKALKATAARLEKKLEDLKLIND